MRHPRPPRESLLARGVGRHVARIELLMGGVTLATQAWAYHDGNPRWRTIAFNILCISQMRHVPAVRSERSFLRSRPFANPALFAAVAPTFALQAAATYVPASRRVLGTHALTAEERLLVDSVSATVFVAVEIEKFVGARSRAV